MLDEKKKNIKLIGEFYSSVLVLCLLELSFNLSLCVCCVLKTIYYKVLILPNLW